MKIGIDISQVVYGTGVSKYTAQLVEHLAKIDKRNEYVLFGASLRGIGKFRDLKEKLTSHKNFLFKVVPIPPTVLEFLWNRLHIVPVEKFIGEVDLFHSSDWIQPPVKSATTKRVTTVHYLSFPLIPSSQNSGHPKKKTCSRQKRSRCHHC